MGEVASGLRLIRSARALARVPEAGQPNPRPASQTDGKGARASGRLPELGHVRSGPQGQWPGADRKQGRSSWWGVGGARGTQVPSQLAYAHILPIGQGEEKAGKGLSRLAMYNSGVK